LPVRVLENADDREVLEGPSLNDDLVAEILDILQLQHLEQAVLDNGIRKSCSDIRHFRTLAKRLFNL